MPKYRISIIDNGEKEILEFTGTYKAAREFAQSHGDSQSRFMIDTIKSTYNTIEELEELLRYLDWWSHMSDDQSVWHRGEEAKKRATHWTKYHGEAGAALWEQYCPWSPTNKAKRPDLWGST